MTPGSETELETHPQGREFQEKEAERGSCGKGIQALGEKEAELNICLARKPEVNVQLLLPLPRWLPQPASSRSHGNWLGRPAGKREKKPSPLHCPHVRLPAGQAQAGGGEDGR